MDHPMEVLLSQRTDRWRGDFQRLEKAVRQVSIDHGYREGEISLVIVDDEEIQQLNREHLQHDWPTDVISFLFSADGRLEGEIIVSMETAIREATDLPWTADDELLLYVIHGMLHLVGYGDLEEGEAKVMREREKHYLCLFEVPGASQHDFEFRPH